jgi:hypothetical protein
MAKGTADRTLSVLGGLPAAHQRGRQSRERVGGDPGAACARWGPGWPRTSMTSSPESQLDDTGSEAWSNGRASTSSVGRSLGMTDGKAG